MNNHIVISHTPIAVIKRRLLSAFLMAFMLLYTVTIFYPLVLMVLTSLKSTKEIFSNPFGLPQAWNFASYVKLLTISKYPIYFRNSIAVVTASLGVIISFSAMASYILAKYEF